MSKPLIKGIAYAVLLVAAAGGLYWWWQHNQSVGKPEPYAFDIGPRTTVIAGPLHPDGTPGYVAALNERLARGVRREENAAIPVLECVGPKVLRGPAVDEVLRRLDLENLLRRGPFFMTQQQFRQSPQGAGAVPPGALVGQVADARRKTWRPADAAGLAAWLDHNRAHLDALVEALGGRTGFHVPVASESEPERLVDATVLDAYRLREVGDALAALSLRKAGAGDAPGALAGLRAVHRLAALLGKAATLDNRRTALNIERVACEADAAFAGFGRLNAGDARELLDAMRTLPKLPDPMPAVDLYERYRRLDCVCVAGREGLYTAMERYRPGIETVGLVPAGADYNAILRRVNGWYDRLLAAARTPDPQRRSATVREVSTELSRFKGRADRARTAQAEQPTSLEVTEDAVVAYLVENPSQSLRMQFRTGLYRNLAVAAAGLAVHRAKTGDWPTDLAALVPDVLPSLPADPYGDGPLRYLRTDDGYVLYSIGGNGRDDEGRRDPRKDYDDIAVRGG